MARYLLGISSGHVNTKTLNISAFTWTSLLVCVNLGICECRSPKANRRNRCRCSATSLLGNGAGKKSYLIKFLESFVLKAQPFSKLRLSSFGVERRGRWEAGISWRESQKLSYARIQPKPPHPRTLQPRRKNLAIERRACQWNSAGRRWITWTVKVCASTAIPCTEPAARLSGATDARPLSGRCPLPFPLSAQDSR